MQADDKQEWQRHVNGTVLGGVLVKEWTSASDNVHSDDAEGVWHNCNYIASVAEHTPSFLKSHAGETE